MPWGFFSHPFFFPQVEEFSFSTSMWEIICAHQNKYYLSELKKMDGKFLERRFQFLVLR